jgi:thioredoxin 1
MASIRILSADDFAQTVERGEGLTLVDFYAEWCGPCKMIAPALTALADEYAGELTVVKVDADSSGDVLAKYAVRGLPTLIMFEDGKPVGNLVGAHPAGALRDFIDQYASARA